jgi:RNA polymerase sigma-70 factor (ECF subfamily)
MSTATANIVRMKSTESDTPRFERITRAQQSMMLVYARTLLRDEELARKVVQEALLAAWRGMERFDVSRDTGAWLRGIIRNKWKDACRREGRRPEFTEENLEYLDLKMERLSERPAIFDDLAECREKLPEDMKEVIRLSYDEGAKSEEAGEHMGIAAATVRKRLERARILLRDCLEGMSE